MNNFAKNKSFAALLRRQPFNEIISHSKLPIDYEGLNNMYRKLQRMGKHANLSGSASSNCHEKSGVGAPDYASIGQSKPISGPYGAPDTEYTRVEDSFGESFREGNEQS